MLALVISTTLQLEHLVLNFNGTMARDGVLLEGLLVASVEALSAAKVVALCIHVYSS